jgi:hypothetical protein
MKDESERSYGSCSKADVSEPDTSIVAKMMALSGTG